MQTTVVRRLQRQGFGLTIVASHQWLSEDLPGVCNLLSNTFDKASMSLLGLHMNSFHPSLPFLHLNSTVVEFFSMSILEVDAIRVNAPRQEPGVVAV